MKTDKIIRFFNEEGMNLEQCIEWLEDHRNQLNKDEWFELCLRVSSIFGKLIF